MVLKKNGVGTCDSCGDPVICPEKPGVNMYIQHQLEENPGPGYVSLVLGSRHIFTVIDPSEGSPFLGVDGNRTLWLYNGLEVWWIDRSGNSGYWDLETEWSIGTVGDVTRGIIAAGADFVIAGSGFYSGIIESDSSTGMHECSIGHVTTSAVSESFLTATDTYDGGTLEAITDVFIVGCQNACFTIVRRHKLPGTDFPDGYAELQFWYGTTITHQWSGAIFDDIPSRIGVRHFYGNVVLASLSFPVSTDWFTYMVDEGELDSSGVFPLVLGDSNFLYVLHPTGFDLPNHYWTDSPMIVSMGIVYNDQASDTTLLDTNGNEQAIVAPVQLALYGAAQHKRREFYSQGIEGGVGVGGHPLFRETNVVTDGIAVGEIAWPAPYFPLNVETGWGGWIDFYFYSSGPINRLLPIAEFTDA